MNTIQLSTTAAAQGKELVYVDVSFEPLIQKFLSNRKKEVPAMEAALAALDFDKVRSISHGMKGAGGSYGFDHITEMAAIIEEAAKSSDASIIQRELPVLSAYLDRVEVVYGYSPRKRKECT